MNIEKLFLHAKETKRLEIEGVISKEISKSFLRQVEPDIVKGLDLSNYYSFIESNQIEYWYKLFYPTQDKVISQLEVLMQKNATPDMTQRLIVDFLSYDAQTKKDFYLTNFIENKVANRELLYINGLSHINCIHHNIHTLYLCNNSSEDKTLLKTIGEDIKKTLSNSQFFELFLPGIVSFSSYQEVNKNWDEWGLAANYNLRSIYATKYLNRNTLLFTHFINDVHANKIEVDIQTPQGVRLMDSLIAKELHGIYSQIQNFNKQDFLDKLKNTKAVFEGFKKYDLSFIDFNKINQYYNQINKNTNILNNFDEDCRKELLDFSITLQLLKVNKAAIIEKKVKI